MQEQVKDKRRLHLHLMHSEQALHRGGEKQNQEER